jgi:hypothetical protein
MIIRVGLENGIEGRSLAWALDFPGCFSYGEDGSTALLNIPKALLEYETWMSRHTPEPWTIFGDFDIKLVEVWQVYTINKSFEVINNGEEGYEVNAWFRDDWRSLSQEEIDHGCEILKWTRNDLMASIKNLSPENLDARYPNERWSIRGILGHVATAEWWYLTRLGLTDLAYEDLPKDVFERLGTVRQQAARALGGLAESESVFGKVGEFWSPRKLLRRIIWHEMDHIGHIGKLTMLKIE